MCFLVVNPVLMETYPRISDVKPLEFTFSQLNNTLGQFAWINAPEGDGIFFQSFDPQKGLGATLRVESFDQSDIYGDSTTYSLSLSLEGSNGESLINCLGSLDERVVAKSMKRATDYFKRPVTKLELLNMYCASLKKSSNENYAPNMKLKVGDERQTKIYKAIVPLRECISIGEVPYTKASVDDIIANSRMHVSVKIGPLWFMKTRFGVTLNAKEILLDKPASEGSETISRLNFGKEYLNCLCDLTVCFETPEENSKPLIGETYTEITLLDEASTNAQDEVSLVSTQSLSGQEREIVDGNDTAPAEREEYPVEMIRRRREEDDSVMVLKERSVQNTLAREEGIDPAEKEFQIEAPGNKRVRADIYRHKGRYETTPELIEIKTWEKRTDAIGQLLYYETLLLEEGKKVENKRIHLFDVPDNSASQHELRLYTETSKRQNIHVTSEGIVTV